MEFVWTDLFAYIGSILCIASFIFLIYRVYKNKSAKDISYGFIGFQLAVNILFSINDIIIASFPLFLGNGSVTILVIIILGLKCMYRRNVGEEEGDDIEMNEIVGE